MRLEGRSIPDRARAGRRAFLLAIALAFPTGCTLNEPRALEKPDVPAPSGWRRAEVAGSAPVGRWWTAFDEPELTAVVEAALDRNREIWQAWSRLDQARAEIEIAGAALVPAVGIAADGTYTYTRDQDIGGSFGSFGIPPIAGASGGDGDGGFPFGSEELRQSTLGYAIVPQVRWEIDLWGKIAARRDAAALRLEAQAEDVRATALMIAGRVVEAWFQAREQHALLVILEEQIAASRELVELTELRFSMGQVGALDVLQQRRQLLAVESERPPIAAALARAEDELAVLTGSPPAACEPLDAAAVFWTLPPFPALVRPDELIAARPDLRRARALLRAADREHAAALAERLPSLDLSLSYRTSAARGPGLFDREVLSAIAGLTAPLFEGGRLDAEAERRRAIVRERFDAFGQAYLVALREVEGALVDERRQVDLLALLDRQLEVAREGLVQARRRYGNGLASYLEVLTAVQARQELERRLIVERRRLMSQRAMLYRALGGAAFDDLRRPAALEDEPR